MYARSVIADDVCPALPLAWLKRSGKHEVSQREIYEGVKGRASLQRVEHLRPVVERLVRHNARRKDASHALVRLLRSASRRVANTNR
jgi:hypothetical protein